MTEKPIRVLLVEDDNEDFLIIQKMLTVVKKKCFELDRVSTYKAAIQKLEQRDHDVCLLDYRLEGRNGLDLLKEAALKGHTIPIIFLTGQGEHEVDVEAIQLGAADFLYKNKIDGDMLERSVRYALERHKAEENRIRLAAIVESSEDAIYSVTLEGVILSWNAGAQRVYGFAAEEAGGGIYRSFFPRPKRRNSPRFYRWFGKGRPSSTPWPLTEPNKARTSCFP